MSAEFISRVIGLILFAVAGLTLGEWISELFPGLSLDVLFLRIFSSVILGILGFMVTPWISVHPFRRLHDFLQQTPPQTLLSALLGLFVGLAFGALIAYPLSLLPDPFGQVLPFIIAALFGYLGVMVTTTRSDLMQIVRTRLSPEECLEEEGKAYPILLDTSVIIDGRIVDICSTGFIRGEFVVPLFVLNELQHIADSSDALRRNRGRRGLEILRQLQEQEGALVPVRIVDDAVEGVKEVDDKLITLARKLNGSIMTNDYNLNRVAELQGVTVLNVNELANAVKTVLLPGETFSIHVIQEGKEFGQGVGYLDDGTMVVVEGGRDYIGRTIGVVVGKVLQTAAGRMIFARPEDLSD